MLRWPSTPAQRAREDFGGKDSGKCTESEPHVPSLVMQEDASAGGQRVDRSHRLLLSEPLYQLQVDNEVKFCCCSQTTGKKQTTC